MSTISVCASASFAAAVSPLFADATSLIELDNASSAIHASDAHFHDLYDFRWYRRSFLVVVGVLFVASLSLGLSSRVATLECVWTNVARSLDPPAAARYAREWLLVPPELWEAKYIPVVLSPDDPFGRPKRAEDNGARARGFHDFAAWCCSLPCFADARTAVAMFVVQASLLFGAGIVLARLTMLVDLLDGTGCVKLVLLWLMAWAAALFSAEAFFSRYLRPAPLREGTLDGLAPRTKGTISGLQVTLYFHPGGPWPRDAAAAAAAGRVNHINREVKRFAQRCALGSLLIRTARDDARSSAVSDYWAAAVKATAAAISSQSYTTSSPAPTRSKNSAAHLGGRDSWCWVFSVVCFHIPWMCLGVRWSMSSSLSSYHGDREAVHQFANMMLLCSSLVGSSLFLFDVR